MVLLEGLQTRAHASHNRILPLLVGFPRVSLYASLNGSRSRPGYSWPIIAFGTEHPQLFMPGLSVMMEALSLGL